MSTLTSGMTGQEMVALSKQHSLFEWSAQGAVDPIPVARAKGIALDFDEVNAYITNFASKIPNARPSMLLDHLARTRSDQACRQAAERKIGRAHV